MTRSLLLGGALAVLVAMGLTSDGETVHETMVDAARRLIDLTDDTQMAQLQLAIDDANRLDWHYVPRTRQGLAIRDMSQAQRQALHRLLRSALSTSGYQQSVSIMELDQVLHDIAAAAGRRADHRDPELYWVAIFGEPGDGAWGWRLEGHHLSLNFTSAGGEVIGVTPLFQGANPAHIDHGHRRDGFRALGEEGDLAWSLLRSLSDEQRQQVIVSDQAPRDVILSPGVDRLGEVVGLPVSEMTDEQRSIARRLLDEYVHDLDAELASAQLVALGDQGFERMRFAWMGATEPDAPHYWRLHAGSFVIEYDNVQNGANHVHTVWRDLTSDFGGDVLRRHLEAAHAQDR